MLTIEFQKKGHHRQPNFEPVFKKKEEEKSSRATNRQTLILYQVCKIDIRDY